MKKEIERFLLPDKAYEWLHYSSFIRSEYPETSHIIAEYSDRENQTLTVPPKVVARELMEADKSKLMPDDIFWFIEKVLRDTYYQIKDLHASYELGCLYYFDRFNHVDYVKAFKYFSKEDIFNDSNTMVGVCYFYGQGIEQNFEKAYHQLVKSALVDCSAWALYLLGDMYHYGYYVEKDLLEANDIYQHALKVAEKLESTKLTQAEIFLRLGDNYRELGDDQASYEQALAVYNIAEIRYVESIHEGNPFIKMKIDKVREKQKVVKEILDHILFEEDNLLN